MNDVPDMQFVIAFQNFSFQLMIPSNNERFLTNEPLRILNFPIPFDSSCAFGETSYYNLDLTSNEIVTDDPVSFNMSFEMIKKLSSAQMKDWMDSGNKLTL